VRMALRVSVWFGARSMEEVLVRAVKTVMAERGTDR